MKVSLWRCFVLAETKIVEQQHVEKFVKDYLQIVEEEKIEISNKRNTLKCKVKSLAGNYFIPKDFANYISLFLMLTKFIFIKNNVWYVNTELKKKLEIPGFLNKNLFKFLFFSKEYNEHYRSPMVFNTTSANNDYEVINKRKTIIKTMPLFYDYDTVPFNRILEVLTTRYAFFREYNDPKNFYYTKIDVYSNKHFIFLFIFKTLHYLGVISAPKKGKLITNHSFKVTDFGRNVIDSYLNNKTTKNNKLITKKENNTDINLNDDYNSSKIISSPSKIILKDFDKPNKISALKESYTTIPTVKGFTIFSSLEKNSKLYTNQDALKLVKQNLINKTTKKAELLSF